MLSRGQLPDADAVKDELRSVLNGILEQQLGAPVTQSVRIGAPTDDQRSLRRDVEVVGDVVGFAKRAGLDPEEVADFRFLEGMLIFRNACQSIGRFHDDPDGLESRVASHRRDLMDWMHAALSDGGGATHSAFLRGKAEGGFPEALFLEAQLATADERLLERERDERVWSAVEQAAELGATGVDQATIAIASSMYFEPQFERAAAAARRLAAAGSVDGLLEVARRRAQLPGEWESGRDVTIPRNLQAAELLDEAEAAGSPVAPRLRDQMWSRYVARAIEDEGTTLHAAQALDELSGRVPISGKVLAGARATIAAKAVSEASARQSPLYFRRARSMVAGATEGLAQLDPSERERHVRELLHSVCRVLQGQGNVRGTLDPSEDWGPAFAIGTSEGLLGVIAASPELASPDLGDDLMRIGRWLEVLTRRIATDLEAGQFGVDDMGPSLRQAMSTVAGGAELDAGAALAALGERYRDMGRSVSEAANVAQAAGRQQYGPGDLSAAASGRRSAAQALQVVDDGAQRPQQGPEHGERSVRPTLRKRGGPNGPEAMTPW